jgi:hypothetical protein
MPRGDGTGPQGQGKAGQKGKGGCKTGRGGQGGGQGKVRAGEAVKVRDRAGDGSKEENSPKAKVANKIGLN